MDYTVSLTSESGRLVEAEVQAGRYASAGEAVEDALRHYFAPDEKEALERLRAEVAIGVAEAERGEFSTETISDMIATMERRY